MNNHMTDMVTHYIYNTPS